MTAGIKVCSAYLNSGLDLVEQIAEQLRGGLLPGICEESCPCMWLRLSSTPKLCRISGWDTFKIMQSLHDDLHTAQQQLTFNLQLQ